MFQIDESKKPVQITMTDVPANAATKLKETNERQDALSITAAGILKFDGKSKWMLCYGLPGTDRPQKFASPTGSKIMLFKMQRNKPGADLLDTSEPLRKE